MQAFTEKCPIDEKMLDWCKITASYSLEERTVNMNLYNITTQLKIQYKFRPGLSPFFSSFGNFKRRYFVEGMVYLRGSIRGGVMATADN